MEGTVRFNISLSLPPSFFFWKAKCTHSWSIFKSINWISPRWHTDLQISHAGKMLSVMHFIFCTHTHTLAQTDAQTDVHIQAYIKPYANIVSISCLEMDLMALLWKQREEGGEFRLGDREAADWVMCCYCCERCQLPGAITHTWQGEMMWDEATCHIRNLKLRFNQKWVGMRRRGRIHGTVCVCGQTLFITGTFGTNYVGKNIYIEPRKNK